MALSLLQLHFSDEPNEPLMFFVDDEESSQNGAEGPEHLVVTLRSNKPHLAMKMFTDSISGKLLLLIYLWEGVFVKNERKDLSELRKISNAVWERDVVFTENKMAIFEKTEKAMMRAMCGVKMIEKRRSQELNEFPGLKDTLDELARASGIRWYGQHVLRRDNGDVLRRALDFEVAGRKGRGRPNLTWKKQVEEHTIQIGLKKEDAIVRAKLRDGVYELSRNMRWIRPLALTQTKPDLETRSLIYAVSFCSSIQVLL